MSGPRLGALSNNRWSEGTGFSDLVRPVYMSHSMHEVTMFYPMRAIKIEDYKIIHNMNWQTPFPIDQDFYMSPTFQVDYRIIER